jgi:hypothetical protein
MPNWCSNFIEFSSDNSEGMSSFRSEMDERDPNMGWLPKFMKGDRKYLFEIYINSENDNGFSINCESKWSPPIEELVMIADHYGINFYIEYEELNNYVFGKSEYSDGKLFDAFLTDEEIDSVNNEDDDRWDAYNDMLDNKQLNQIK